MRRWLVGAAAVALTIAAPAVCTAQQNSFPTEDPSAPLSSQSMQDWLDSMRRTLEQNPEYLLNEAQEIRKDLLVKTGADRAWYARRLAEVYEAVERDNDAAESWKRSVSEFAAMPGSQPEEAYSRGALGVVLLRSREPGGPESLEAALGLATAEEKRPGAAHTTLVAVSSALQSLDLGWARRFQEAARDKAARFAPWSADLLSDTETLASMDLTANRFSAATAEFEQARAIAQRLRQVLSELSKDDQAKLDRATAARDGALMQELNAQLMQRRTRIYRFTDADIADLLGIAAIARLSGDYARALDANTQAGEIAKDLPPESPSHVNVLLQRAHILIDRGSFRDASMAVREAMERVGSANDNPPALINALSIAGRLELERGDLNRAIQYLRVAEDDMMVVQVDPRVMDLNDEYIARWAYQSGSLQDARQRLDRLQRRYEQWSIPLDAARIRMLRATLDPEWTKERREQELQAVQKIVAEIAPRSILMASIEDELGGQRFDQAEGERHFRSALGILLQAAPRSRPVIYLLRNLGMLAQSAEDRERLLRESWDLVRSRSQEYAGEGALQMYALELQGAGVELAAALTHAGKIDEAFTVIERSRANGLQRQLADKRNLGDLWKAHQFILSQLQLKAAGYQSANTAYNALGFSFKKLEDRKASSNQIEEARLALDRARDTANVARGEYVTYLEGSDAFWQSLEADTAPPPSGPVGWRDQLGPGTLLVMFSIGRGWLLVAAADRERGVEIRSISLSDPALSESCDSSGGSNQPNDLFAAIDCLTRLAGRAPTAADGAADIARFATASRALFSALFPEPIRERVLSARRLIVSPDGVLWNVPFAALVTNAADAPLYLGTQIALSYTTSLEAWTASHVQDSGAAAGAPSALVVEGASGTLAGTAAEARQVSCVYKSTLLSNDDATEPKVRKLIESADLVHIATHGKADPMYPMQSALRLAATPNAGNPNAGAETPGPSTRDVDRTGDDGQLQAWEVFSQLRLRAELVVLSACETGEGTIVSGDGVIGLPRAFQYAGARSVVASLWKVPDRATAVLMTRFYQAVGQGAAKDAALREAMREVQSASDFAHPYNWAAFDLYGNPENGGLRATASCPSQ